MDHDAHAQRLGRFRLADAPERVKGDDVTSRVTLEELKRPRCVPELDHFRALLIVKPRDVLDIALGPGPEPIRVAKVGEADERDLAARALHRATHRLAILHPHLAVDFADAEDLCNLPPDHACSLAVDVSVDVEDRAHGCAQGIRRLAKIETESIGSSGGRGLKGCEPAEHRPRTVRAGL